MIGLSSLFERLTLRCLEVWSARHILVQIMSATLSSRCFKCFYLKIAIIFFDSIIDVIETLTIFRMGGGLGKKSFPNSFSPVTSLNVRITSQNCLAFSLNSFKPFLNYLKPHWLSFQNNTCCQSPVIELEPRPPPLKVLFFSSNRYKIQVIITSLIEMLANDHIYKIIWEKW